MREFPSQAGAEKEVARLEGELAKFRALARVAAEPIPFGETPVTDSPEFWAWFEAHGNANRIVAWSAFRYRGADNIRKLVIVSTIDRASGISERDGWFAVFETRVFGGPHDAVTSIQTVRDRMGNRPSVLSEHARLVSESVPKPAPTLQPQLEHHEGG